MSPEHMARKGAFLYQIAYSQETWDSIPPGMLGLDNRVNERPDWAEYWPMRRFLETESLDDDALYGFLSPLFTRKTGVSPKTLSQFMEAVADDVDVVACSPFFDIRVVFRNVFEHAEFAHPGLMDLSQKVVDEILPGIELREIVNCSSDAIFCNFFAAKPRFWREWLSVCERIFQIAESSEHPLARALNCDYHRLKEPMPAKVFIVECIASLLLATSDRFKVEAFGQTTMTDLFHDMSPATLPILDRLKSPDAICDPILSDAFGYIQNRVLSSERPRAARNWVLSKNMDLHASSRGYEHWAEGIQTMPKKQVDRPGLSWILRRLFNVRDHS